LPACAEADGPVSAGMNRPMMHCLTGMIYVTRDLIGRARPRAGSPRSSGAARREARSTPSRRPASPGWAEVDARLGRHNTSADALAGMIHSIAGLDCAIIRPRRKACPEAARTKPIRVRLTFCQPWAPRLLPWSMRPWESPPPMRWRGGTDSHGRMDHRGGEFAQVG
jgi:hypothetical protein